MAARHVVGYGRRDRELDRLFREFKLRGKVSPYLCMHEYEAITIATWDILEIEVGDKFISGNCIDTNCHHFEHLL